MQFQQKGFPQEIQYLPASKHLNVYTHKHKQDKVSRILDCIRGRWVIMLLLMMMVMMTMMVMLMIVIMIWRLWWWGWSQNIPERICIPGRWVIMPEPNWLSVTLHPPCIDPFEHGHHWAVIIIILLWWCNCDGDDVMRMIKPSLQTVHGGDCNNPR